jgi:hypothetical protein
MAVAVGEILEEVDRDRQPVRWNRPARRSSQGYRNVRILLPSHLIGAVACRSSSDQIRLAMNWDPIRACS